MIRQARRAIVVAMLTALAVAGPAGMAFADTTNGGDRVRVYDVAPGNPNNVTDTQRGFLDQ